VIRMIPAVPEPSQKSITREAGPPCTWRRGVPPHRGLGRAVNHHAKLIPRGSQLTMTKPLTLVFHGRFGSHGTLDNIGSGTALALNSTTSPG